MGEKRERTGKEEGKKGRIGEDEEKSKKKIRKREKKVRHNDKS